MAFNVRLFGHRGISALQRDIPKQLTTDSVNVLVQPYEWAENISVSAAAASSTANTAKDKVTILRIEVPDGESIRYEINPPGRSVAAFTDSPILSGHEQFYFAPGWTISMIDAAGLP